MNKTQISMDYDPEGDILSITFGAPGRKGRGYELSEHIYIRVHPTTGEPLGLTLLSYSKLLALGEVSLSLWGDLTPKACEMMEKILSTEPVNRFISVKARDIPVPLSAFQNPSLQEIVAI